MSLYPNHKPSGVKPEWDHTSMETYGSGEVMRRYGAPESLGPPVDAVAWFDMESGALKLLVADYADGQRATLWKRRRGTSLHLTKPGDA